MAAANDNPGLQEAFTNFAKFGDGRSDGRQITLTNADKWMKQAKVIDGKKITTTDTGICFNKLRTRTLSYPEFVKYVEDLAIYKKANSDDLKNRLATCGVPGTTQATGTLKVGGVDRLTNAAQYTGTHKQRFDESGKGKGLAGREDIADDKGYVGAYKGANTYDETHKKKEK